MRKTKQHCLGVDVDQIAVANIERNDPRNSLAEEFCRIVHDLQPEWIVFENVVGLLTHDKGKTFQATIEAFEEIG